MQRSREITWLVDESTGCWICTSHAASPEYPRIRDRLGNKVTIARLFYERYNGNIPGGLLLRHTCDNRRCINPEHLLVGTNADNVRDRVERNRSAIGERNGSAKLNTLQINAIRSDISCTQSQLASRYGVSQGAISLIKRFKLRKVC